MASDTIQGAFFGRLRVEYVNGQQWPLINPPDDEQFGFRLRSDGAVTLIVPPDRFVTDFATIPRFFWLLLPPVGDGAHARYGIAAVVHDWLYVCGKVEGNQISKAFADKVFLACMTASGVASWKRKVMYLAVFLFGRGAWKRHNKTHRNPNPTMAELQIDREKNLQKKVVLLKEFGPS
jgi:hypothetical protein